MKEYGNLNFILNQIFKTKDYKKCAVSLIIDIIFFKDKVEVSWLRKCKTHIMTTFHYILYILYSSSLKAFGH